jgi:pyruvate dehydrogenase E1 component alpha subunit
MPPKRKRLPAGNPLLNNDKLRQLYTSMMHCRMLAERASLPSRGNRGQGLELRAGHEATVAGVVSHLRPEDTLSPAPGDLSAGFLKGAPLQDVVSLLAGIAVNGQLPFLKNSSGLNLMPAMTNFELQLSLATGSAFGYRMQSNARVVVAFLADGWPTLPGCREALAFAARHELPIVYVSQTKLIPGLFSGDGVQKRSAQPGLIPDSDLPVIPVDGNDVVAVYRVAQESILRARLGSGPTLIEAQEHAGSGQSEASGNPIAIMEAYLTAKGLFNAAWKRRIERKFSRELDVAWKAAAKPPATIKRRRQS